VPEPIRPTPARTAQRVSDLGEETATRVGGTTASDSAAKPSTRSTPAGGGIRPGGAARTPGSQPD